MSDSIVQLNGSDIGLPETDFVTISAHPGDEGLRLGMEVNERFSDALLDLQTLTKELEQSESTDTEDGEGQQSSLVPILKKLISALPSKEIVPFAKKLFQHTRIARTIGEEKPKTFNLSKDADFNLYFQRNYSSLMPLMREVIAHNGFFTLDPSALIMSRQVESE